MIKNLQKVSGFLGSADKPTPISDNEIKRILGQVSESAVTQKTGVHFEIGENIWLRFNGGKKETLWYYSELSKSFSKLINNKLTIRFNKVVKQLQSLA